MSDLLPSREVLITIGVILSVAAMVLLIILENKMTVRMFVIGAMILIATVPAGMFGELVRKLTYGNWNTLVSGFFEYEGTHYLGRAIYTIFSGLVLWKIVMRKEEGIFAKNGVGRYMGTLSLIMLIQVITARLGCISNGCCVGKTNYGVLSVYNADLGCSVYPAVHTELIISLITFAVVVDFYIKRKNAFSAFCIGYSIALFIAEFMYDSTGTIKILGLTIVQILSALIFGTGIIFGHLTAGSEENKINHKYCGNKLPQKRRKSL